MAFGLLSSIPMMSLSVPSAFRANLVTLENGLMKDYSAGHITTEEAEELSESVRRGNPMYSRRSFFADLQMRIEDVLFELLKRGRLFIS